jgi:hypothetical protein
MSKRLETIVTVRFDAETAEQMRVVAKRMNLPYTNLVRLAVTRFLALPDEWQPRLNLVTSHSHEEE